MNSSITVRAPAKINLGLAVLRRRADGYHDLASVMQQISLSDTLVLRPGLESAWEFFCTDSSLAGQGNLVFQAALLLAREAKRKLPGVRITLYKQIPVEAGLGGGSSDAAAALWGLNRFWRLNFSEEKLKELGAQLGSDIPFCLQGGTALATGRGEVLEPLPALPFHWVVLAVPHGLRLSTAAVYRSLDLSRVSAPQVSILVEAIRGGERNNIASWFKRATVNTLEEAVLPHYHAIARLKERLLELGLNPAMSGSGPSVFALTDRFAAASAAARSLQEEGNRAFLCWTAPQQEERKVYK
jgi:4-diphosphocytidyl-2-C-methyl-D-erythritol kinase